MNETIIYLVVCSSLLFAIGFFANKYRNEKRNRITAEQKLVNYPNPAMFQEPLLPLDMNHLTAVVEMGIKYDTNKQINEKFIHDKHVVFDGVTYKLKQLDSIHREEKEENIAIRVMGLEVDRVQFGLFLFSVQFRVDTTEIIKGELRWEDKEYELLFNKGALFHPKDTFVFTNEGVEYKFKIGF